MTPEWRFDFYEEVCQRGHPEHRGRVWDRRRRPVRKGSRPHKMVVEYRVLWRKGTVTWIDARALRAGPHPLELLALEDK